MNSPIAKTFPQTCIHHDIVIVANNFVQAIWCLNIKDDHVIIVLQKKVIKTLTEKIHRGS